ncbi:MAG: hypothetical protein WD749_11070 [Phycisphaerales bacterium]
MFPRIGIAAVAGISGCLAACGLAQPAGEPPRAGVPVAAQPSGEFASAEDLLAALEKADERLESLAAGIRYTRTFELQGDRQVRMGDLYFVSGGNPAPGDAPVAAPPAGRKFAVVFNQVRVGEVVRDDPKVYIFDGRWLVEKFPQERPPLFIKREVVAPGESFDPLRIGEGPFPLPIGQKRADILRRYTVELLPAAAGLEADPEAPPDEAATAAALKEFVAGSSHIRLVPKPEFEADEELAEIHLWYRRDGAGNLLPRMARTRDKSLNVSVVELINVQVQRTGEARNQRAAVPPDVLDTREPAPGSGWEVQVQAWRKPAADGGPAREGPGAGEP